MFGTLQYFDESAGLIQFLARSTAEDIDWSVARGWRATYEFWPWVQRESFRGCEPDVLIRLDTGDGGKFLVVIEAKYRSGKSSFAEPAGSPGNAANDQLAREWQNTNSLARDEERLPLIIYLTADLAVPHEELDESRAELAECGDSSSRIVWLSWRHLDDALAGTPHAQLGVLREVMRDRYSLCRFDGFIGLDARELSWTFSIPVKLPPVSEVWAWNFGAEVAWILSSSVEVPRQWDWPAATAEEWAFERETSR